MSRGVEQSTRGAGDGSALWGRGRLGAPARRGASGLAAAALAVAASVLGAPTATAAPAAPAVEAGAQAQAEVELPPDGTFVTWGGAVYRLAGGVRTYVSSWVWFGGPQPTVPLTEEQAYLSQARDMADGTFVRDASDGRVYRVVLATPIYVSSWAPFGGPRTAISIDPRHFDQTEDNGTLKTSTGWFDVDPTFVRSAQTGRVYRMAGGAPTYVGSWAAVGGRQSYVDIDQAAIDRAGQPGPWRFVLPRPEDGTQLQVSPYDREEYYVVAGGAPVYYLLDGEHDYDFLQTPRRVDRLAVERAGTAPHLGALRQRPADGTFIGALTEGGGGGVYVIRGGAPYYVPSWKPYGGPQPVTWVDDDAIERAGTGGVWDHLAKPVAP